MLTKMAILYLRKRKVSVLMGFITDGGSLQPSNSVTYIRDNSLINTDFYTKDGELFLVPRGKFEYKEQSK